MSRKRYKNINRTIYLLLLKFPELRDDWMSTVREVHILEMDIYGIKSEDYFQTLYYTEKLSSPQTIARVWRLTQEHKPHLRGLLWKDRQKQGGNIKNKISGYNQNQTELNLELDFSKK